MSKELLYAELYGAFIAAALDVSCLLVEYVIKYWQF
jgi:hypothetical protein